VHPAHPSTVMIVPLCHKRLDAPVVNSSIESLW